MRRLAAFIGCLILVTGCGGGKNTDEDTATLDTALDEVTDLLEDTLGEPDLPMDTREEDQVTDELDDHDAIEDTTADASDVLVEPEATLPPGCVTGTYAPYWGNMHAHTGNSDGEGTPAIAFAYARDVAGLDFMIVTDHLEQLYLPANRWETCGSHADAANVPGTYVSLCGYEYGSGFNLLAQSTGHANVFFFDDLMPEIQLDFHDFYDSVVACPDCITQFNHPGDEPMQIWNDWEYFPAVDIKMNLFELSGSDTAWDLLFDALDRGWHVAPTYNQDNHSADWGTANDRRTGFLLTALTRNDIHEAMKERRAFASWDLNAWVSLTTSEGCSMGSILSGVASTTIELHAQDGDTDEGFASIEFFGPGHTSLGSTDCADANPCTATVDVTTTSSATYVLGRATQTDGDFLVSAPIWLAP